MMKSGLRGHSPGEAVATRIFCNSLPKSGTFLLSRALAHLGFPRREQDFKSKVLARLGLGVPFILSHDAVAYWERRVLLRCFPNEPEVIPVGVFSPLLLQRRLVERWLATAPEGMQFLGHVPYSAGMDELLARHGYGQVVIFRDPRDVLVSLLHYLLHPAHPLSADLLRLDRNERVSLLLHGGYAPLSGRKLLGLAEAYRSVLDWRRSDNALLVSFEELVGERGGGRADLQLTALSSIARHVGVHLDEHQLRSVSDCLYSRDSITFRKGLIGSWEEELGDWRELFRETGLLDIAGCGSGKDPTDRADDAACSMRATR